MDDARKGVTCVRTARLVAASYDTTVATSAFNASRTCTVVDVIVDASMASLKVTVTVEVADTPVTLLAGEVAVTEGGVVSTGGGGGAPPEPIVTAKPALLATPLES